MPYPDSPFSNNFNTNLITKCENDDTSDLTPTIQNLAEVLKWLCDTPTRTTFRVNTLDTSVEKAEVIIKKHCNEKFSDKSSVPEVYRHPILEEVIVVKHFPKKELERFEQEVIVDCTCAAALLRGAHIFAPGVLGMTPTTKPNDTVSVYADLYKKCKKGFQKIFNDEGKVFIGNGLVKISRYELFVEKKFDCGVAVEMVETISGCASIGDNFAPPGFVLLQNLPSIICTRILNPKPGETVLDLCASPGNKTTHMGAMMMNQGLLIAIDKTEGKLARLQQRCKEFGVQVISFQFDSTKILDDNGSCPKDEDMKPPFRSDTFDKILLDAPCSVLGKRPQLSNQITEKELKSYVPLQKKLVRNAVRLLKPNGFLVYSTCTITLAENEGMVEWTLKSFPNMKLVEADLHFGSPGWPGTTLTDDQRNKVQRFGPNDNTNSIGFFIAKFVKTNVSITE